MRPTACCPDRNGTPTHSATKPLNSLKPITILAAIALTVAACQKPVEQTRKPIQLITLDPGHFHAALIQKTGYPEIDSVVNVYGPAGPDLDQHLARIESYNGRQQDPTGWTEIVHTSNTFFDEMIADHPGNVVVISGNNKLKTDYILKSLQAGFHVFADKPMVIDQKGFASLHEAFRIAGEKKLLLYDIMTERFEITTMLQKELSLIPEIFGTLEPGTPDNPAITKESIHHFHKYVSGSVLTRPAWFMDTEQQGEGIVDVQTHLVDLVQWEAFPGQVIDYQKDIEIASARRWNTDMTLSQFKAITKLASFPDYLMNNVVSDTVLKVSSNGEIIYKLKGVYAKTSVIWNYQAPEGTGDTHYSIMRGTKANLVIRQGAAEKYQTTLYIEPVVVDKNYESTLTTAFAAVEQKYPGVKLEKTGNAWTVTIPDSYKEGHEAHFARVTKNFIDYMVNGNMPEWEVPNMIAKYATTTMALDKAK